MLQYRCSVADNVPVAVYADAEKRVGEAHWALLSPFLVMTVTEKKTKSGGFITKRR